MVVEVDIAPPDYRDPAKMLRNIADEIEAGDFGDVETIVVAFAAPGGIETFGGGKLADYRFCHYLFSAAATRFASMPWGGL